MKSSILTKSRVFVFGIDGLPPQLVFKQYKKELPTLAGLIKYGVSGELHSTVPPLSSVAWTSLNSGRDPGETGIHGYTLRPQPGKPPVIVDSTNVRVPMLWDILTAHGKRSVVLNVPLTYPARKINGVMITDFLTPAFNTKSIYPATHLQEIKEIAGGDYLFDIPFPETGAKENDLKTIIAETYRLTHQHIAVAKHLMKSKDWDLFNMVIIGTDRLHHILWKYIDLNHAHYKKSPYGTEVLKFYKFLDTELAKLIKLAGKNTITLIVSDHGMDRMDGQINLNDWLIREGYLTLKPGVLATAKEPQRLRDAMIDWKKTMAMASGGYQGRIFLYGKKNNARLAEEIGKKLIVLHGANNKKLETKVFNTRQIYRRYDPEAPDLIVYFDNLRYGVSTTVGNADIATTGAGHGIDDAGHATAGSMIIAPCKKRQKKQSGPFSIYQVAPTILKILGIQEYTSLPEKPII